MAEIETVNAEELGFTQDDLDGIVGVEEQGAPSELQEEEPNVVNPQDEPQEPQGAEPSTEPQGEPTKPHGDLNKALAEERPVLFLRLGNE